MCRAAATSPRDAIADLVRLTTRGAVAIERAGKDRVVLPASRIRRAPIHGALRGPRARTAPWINPAARVRHPCGAVRARALGTDAGALASFGVRAPGVARRRGPSAAGARVLLLLSRCSPLRRRRGRRGRGRGGLLLAGRDRDDKAVLDDQPRAEERARPRLFLGCVETAAALEESAHAIKEPLEIIGHAGRRARGARGRHSPGASRGSACTDRSRARSRRTGGRRHRSRRTGGIA